MIVELEMDLYDDIIALPFQRNRQKYSETILNIVNSSLVSDDAKAYIKELEGFKERWASAYRKEDFIIGVQTTSRIESLHAIIKKFIRSKCSLTEFCFRLVEFANGKNEQVKKEAINDPILNLLGKNVILSRIKEDYSDFIYNKCLVSFALAAGLKSLKIKSNIYEVTSFQDDVEKKYIVTLENSQFICTCWYNKHWGIPCSHIIATANLMPTKYVDYITIKPRWKKNIDFQSQDKELVKYLKEKIAQELKYDGKLLFLL